MAWKIIAAAAIPVSGSWRRRKPEKNQPRNHQTDPGGKKAPDGRMDRRLLPQSFSLGDLDRRFGAPATRLD